jgi:hypothetical protein
MTIRHLILYAVLSVSTVGAASTAEDPVSRLRHARSLRCTFTSEVATFVRSGHRTVEQTTVKDTATYDNIDVAKGTARIVANGGAADLAVSVERTWGGLWMLERAPSGNLIVTTVFPLYAEGTDEFVVLEARHSMVGVVALGQDTYGTCKVAG